MGEVEALYGDYGPAYSFQSFYIPNYMIGGIRRYIEQGIPPGDFLSAIICNDLSGAVGKADDINIKNLPAYVAYFYNEAPSNCWGSRKKMVAWMEQFVKPTVTLWDETTPYWNQDGHRRKEG